MNFLASFVSHVTGSILPLLAGFIGVSFLIIIHEFGHFLFAKFFRIKTPSFSVGFGPLIFSRMIGSTEFMVRLFPMGGYVELATDQPETAPQPDTFNAKPYYQKLLVMIGGIAFNLAFAYLVFIVLFGIGIPQTPILYPLNATNIIKTVESSSAAERSGIKEGDRILNLGGVNAQSNIEQIVTFIQQNPNKQIHALIERNGNKVALPITIGERSMLGSTVGSLGIVFAMQSLQSPSFIQAIIDGIKTTNTFIFKTLQGFTSIVRKGSIKSMAGPISIISMTVHGAAQGFGILLILLAIISINLAVLNLFPLPIFDGGQILINTIEACMGRTFPERVREYIAIASWLLVLMLVLYLSTQDIARMVHVPLEYIKQAFGWAK